MSKTTTSPSERIPKDCIDRLFDLAEAAVEYGNTLASRAGDIGAWSTSRASLMAEAMNFYLAVKDEVSKRRAKAHRVAVTSSGDTAKP